MKVDRWLSANSRFYVAPDVPSVLLIRIYFRLKLPTYGLTFRATLLLGANGYFRSYRVY